MSGRKAAARVDSAPTSDNARGKKPARRAKA
jgi:hypothetical protein